LVRFVIVEALSAEGFEVMEVEHAAAALIGRHGPGASCFDAPGRGSGCLLHRPGLTRRAPRCHCHIRELADGLPRQRASRRCDGSCFSALECLPRVREDGFSPPGHEAVLKGGHVGDALDAADVGRIYKQMARRVGLSAGDIARITGHSTRVGAAQDLLR
jgi:hypothetical protein